MEWLDRLPARTGSLQNPINRYATQVYSSDGKVLGTWHLDKENRVVVPYEKISPYVVNALVATEDERFYEHSGIDFWALVALSSSAASWGKLRREEAPPSPSSLPSSFIARRLIAPWSD